MSKIIAALEGKASVEVGSFITKAVSLEIETNGVSSTGEFSSDDTKLAITNLTKSISDRADALITLFTVIEDSQHPEEFFDTESVEELTDAVVMIQSFKDILKIQHNGLVRRVGIDSEAAQSFNVVRRATAKLYSSVMNLISLHKQLCISENSEYKPELVFSSEVAGMLKKATDSTVTKSSR
ncbi:hypothetical protein ACP43V_16045 [Vibrio genomosp. F10 str. 9ZC157]|uniref:hypothetical protein n=1 Tax=Vibrio genomosp. F10 TaxID=723171 RepID=UPI00037D83A2|nr:hypothetical protein [Vibrio genomosp. F10]OEE93467.1 hypothetical protein A1QM_09285 [Vibrio genomosp. F10 str. 9ZC157]